MPGPFVHAIDPVLGEAGGVYFWWYGLSYTLGFLELFLFLRKRRGVIGLTLPEVYSLTLLFAIGVLVGGRAIEVAFDEWAFYRDHPQLIPAYWLGGMATHGLLLGAAAGTWIFCLRAGKPLRDVADALVIPGAFLLGMGRIGNFIDGQIVGRTTDEWWGVKFPDAEGFRHPVVLYDAGKNLLLIPLLLWVRRRRPIPGAMSAHFIFWYAFLRIFVDLFRDYPSHRVAIGTGQLLNLVMASLGLLLIARSEWRWRHRGQVLNCHFFQGVAPTPPWGQGLKKVAIQDLAPQRAALAGVLVFCLTMPGNWTQDVPGRYGKRHPGMRHSRLYPAIDTAPRGVSARLGSRSTP